MPPKPKVDWGREKRLGKMPDVELARELGVARTTVTGERTRRGIPRSPDGLKRTKRGRPTPHRDAPHTDDTEAIERLAGLANRRTPARATPRAPIAGTDLTSVAWVSDVHFPDEDPRAWSAFLSFLDDQEPDVLVLGGDILDIESASSHGGVARPALLVEEVEYARAKLEEIRGLIPHARIVFLEGNHEERVQRMIVDAMPTFSGSLTLPSLLGLDDLEIAWHPYGEVFHVGKIGFTHGWYCNQYHAAKHLSALGESIAYGHTHRAQIHTVGSPNGVRGAFGMPCMCRLDASYLKGRPSGWSQGWGMFYVDEKSGFFNGYQVLVNDGRAFFEGKVYTGRGQ